MSLHVTPVSLQDALQPNLYIDGAFREASKGEVLDVINPTTGTKMASVAAGDASDIDAAVQAAHRQFEEGAWRRLSGADRGKLMFRVADLIERDLNLIAAMEATDNGKPVGMAANVDLPNTIDTLRYYAGWADKLEGRSIPTAGAFGRPTLSYTIREPLGVVGSIGAYNAPTMYIGWKCAAALAAGNTVVLKPAEEAPLTSLYIAKLFAEAGVPNGVFNVVSGYGPVAGMALLRHPLVAKVSYTGGGAVGRLLAKEAAELLKPITLELGGKAPMIVLGDADLDAAIPFLAMGLFANQGQICAAGTRILVHRSRLDAVAEALGTVAKQQVLGDPLDAATTMGPLTTQRSLDRVLGYINTGRSEGAKLIAGGERVKRDGYFVQPTIFKGHNDMRVAREEIFGPVGVLIPFDSNEEALQIANATEYGLNAGIFSRDLRAANLLARGIRTGAVWINGFGLIDARLPWGGVKASGYGRENGAAGLDDVTHEKVVTTLL
ncbi:aldehyde dehydrogenase family protein [Bradyrhizobium sp. CCBAU 53338]|uniref:aldehyde dehydrogenase family protein n=1 Tax=Bradyrhizobium sp. CCBAU 53338 TaxID=1325111 RepID=UPI001889DE85|nr:aldehyde dehydrogenase family protein [Bradyrhizobium sp. CCBAU 53338]QOZ52536.1 betaine-aldehyde dehydrogenase [Bradyrhizobium sp. CCBAU 53338]